MAQPASQGFACLLAQGQDPRAFLAYLAYLSVAYLPAVGTTRLASYLSLLLFSPSLPFPSSFRASTSRHPAAIPHQPDAAEPSRSFPRHPLPVSPVWTLLSTAFVPRSLHFKLSEARARWTLGLGTSHNLIWTSARPSCRVGGTRIPESHSSTGLGPTLYREGLKIIRQ